MTKLPSACIQQKPSTNDDDSEFNEEMAEQVPLSLPGCSVIFFKSPNVHCLFDSDVSEHSRSVVFYHLGLALGQSFRKGSKRTTGLYERGLLFRCALVVLKMHICTQKHNSHLSEEFASTRVPAVTRLTLSICNFGHSIALLFRWLRAYAYNTRRIYVRVD